MIAVNKAINENDQKVGKQIPMGICGLCVFYKNHTSTSHNKS
jgi:hypothetical protein